MYHYVISYWKHTPPVSFIYNTYEAATVIPFRIDAVPLDEPDAEYVAASFNEASTTIGLSALEALPSDALTTRRPFPVSEFGVPVSN
jgi:hypothetical protein